MQATVWYTNLPTHSTPRDDDYGIDPIRSVPGGSARKLPRVPPVSAAHTHHRRTHTAPDIVLGAGSPNGAQRGLAAPLEGGKGGLPPMPPPPPPLGDLFFEPLVSLDSTTAFSDVDLREGPVRGGADNTHVRYVFI